MRTVSFRMVRNLGLLALVAIIAIIGVLSYVTSTRIIRGITSVLREKQPMLEKIDSLRQDFLSARDALMVFSKEEKGDIGLAILSMDDAIEKSNALSKLVAGDEHQQIASFILSAKRFKTAVNAYSKEVKIDPTGSSTQGLERLALDTSKETSAAMGKMISDIRASIKASDINAFIVAKKGKSLITSVVFLGIIVGILTAFFMGKSLMRPINRLVEATQHVAKGDLDYRIEMDNSDEIGQLEQSFNKMTENLEISTNQLRATHEQLQRVQGQLLQSAKMASLGQLAGGVAHEINNPLAGVMNNVQLMIMLLNSEKTPDLNQLKELCTVVEKSSLRCKLIVKSLLDFSHAAKGTFELLQLNIILSQTLGVVSKEIELDNIIVQREYQPVLPDIQGDSQLLQQVVMGLIVNAVWAIKKRQDKAARIITLRTWSKPDENTVYLSVSDNGIGIPREHLSRIFEPFFTTKEVGEGTGLGLALIYKIIENHNAVIQVESQVGAGSTFTICFPAKG